MRPSLVAVVVALVLVVSGCGGSSSDKAGNPKRATTVLTLANSLGDPLELQAFADEVAKRSDGTIRIRFRDRWRWGQRNYEPALVRDVAAGKADLGAVGSRVWNALGVQSFDALTAPFVVDSYALQRDVLQSDVPDAMLRSIEPLGVVGLGLLPGPLRYPLAAPGPLLRPDDYAALRVGYASGRARDTLLALGAKPVVVSGDERWRGIDAVERSINQIAVIGYDQSARHLTANVPLWPRPLVVFASRKAMARLSGAQRSLLRDAMRAAVPGALNIARKAEREGMASLCRRGIDPAQASDDDKAALRDAVAPVLDGLRRDPQTRASLDAITAMRERTDPEPALTCSQQQGASARGLPDGTYTTHLTREDLRPLVEDKALSPKEANDAARATTTLVLDRGGFVLYNVYPEGRRDVIDEGTFSVFRDRFVATANNGNVVRARFTFDGTSLRFHDVSAVADLVVGYGSHPWKKR